MQKILLPWDYLLKRIIIAIEKAERRILKEKKEKKKNLSIK